MRKNEKQERDSAHGKSIFRRQNSDFQRLDGWIESKEAATMTKINSQRKFNIRVLQKNLNFRPFFY